MFTQAVLSEIRDRIPMSSLVGERIQLKKSGRNFKGVCPFHQEKTPSFMVSDDKQIFHCFGCGEGGDAFSFLMKYDGLSFAEAVKALAARCGVALPDEQRRISTDEARQAKLKKTFLRINQIALEWFHERLMKAPHHEDVRNYLISRGIEPSFWTQLNLGASDKSWDALVEHFTSRGVPLELAGQLGLIRQRQSKDGYYDFFRGRLMFPIHSPRGDVIAFGGRVIAGDDEAKYINSPDSPVFHKSMNVYGLSRAADHMRRRDQVLIVEGYMDVIGLIQAGIENVVAPLGTALTDGHVRLIARATKNMVLVFDGDEAGRRAALRALPMFLELGYMPRVALMPSGEDPDSLARSRGAEAITELVDHAPSLFEFFVDGVVARHKRDAAGTADAVAEITPMLKAIRDPVERAIHGERAAKRLDVGESLLRAATGGRASPAHIHANAAAIARARRQTQQIAVPSAERMIVELMVQMPEVVPRVMGELAPEDFDDGYCRTIFELFRRGYDSTGSVTINALAEDIADPELKRELRALAVSDGCVAADESEEVLADCMRVLRRRPHQRGMNELNELIRSAESSGDQRKLYELLRRKNEMAAEMRAVVGKN